MLLSLFLLCAQGVGLHIHSLDHHHDHKHSHNHATEEMGDHAHLSKAHFAFVGSHSDHHHGIASEIDVSPYGLLKSIDNLFAIALFDLLFAFFTFVCLRRLLRYCRERKLTLRGHYLLSPPLRAPPLH